MNKPGNKTEAIYMRISSKLKKLMTVEAKKYDTPDRAGTFSQALDGLYADAHKWRELQKQKVG